MKKIDKQVILNIKKEYLITIAVVGIALMMLGKIGSFRETEVSEKNTETEASFDLDFSYDGDETETEYLSYLTESMEHCLSNMEGVGVVEVFITLESEKDTYMSNSIPTIQGVMVVAEGAENPIVVKDITEACEALFSLNAHKIKVVSRKKENQ